MFHSAEVARANEIMSRYRPIAPKPPPPLDGPTTPSPGAAAAAAAALHLRARPCRSRKRPRAAFSPFPAAKRLKPAPAFLPSSSSSPQLGLAVQSFARQLSPFAPRPSVAAAVAGSGCPDLLTLSLLPCSRPEPVEIDLLGKLQEPKVITPQPVRPVGSSISVDSISIPADRPPTAPPVKRPEEVEEEVEEEALPAVISDSHNRVRLANSAYKQMVGQPECPWLESMVSTPPPRVGRRRINGEVMLDLPENPAIPAATSGFSCKAKIEWACNGKKSFVDAPCDVMRLHCESKDYLFTWRFHTKV